MRDWHLSANVFTRRASEPFRFGSSKTEFQAKREVELGPNDMSGNPNQAKLNR